jgi:hypothetical protein
MMRNSGSLLLVLLYCREVSHGPRIKIEELSIIRIKAIVRRTAYAVVRFLFPFTRPNLLRHLFAPLMDSVLEIRIWLLDLVDGMLWAYLRLYQPP